jgi:primosomal protein N'
MHYTCLDCNYEFDAYPIAHTHQGLFVQMGCPICLKAQAQKKVCPKCGSINLKQTLKNK